MLSNQCDRLVKKKVSELKPFLSSLLPAKMNDIVEYDELWSYVGSKLNRVWLWIALCRRTKQVVAYHLGDRTLEAFKEFYLKKRFGKYYFLNPVLWKEQAKVLLSMRNREQAREFLGKVRGLADTYWHKG